MIANVRPEAYAHLTALIGDVYNRFDENQLTVRCITFPSCSANFSLFFPLTVRATFKLSIVPTKCDSARRRCKQILTCLSHDDSKFSKLSTPLYLHVLEILHEPHNLAFSRRLKVSRRLAMRRLPMMLQKSLLPALKTGITSLQRNTRTGFQVRLKMNHKMN